MAITDYDAPRAPVIEDDSLEEIQARRAAVNSGSVDTEETETFELPGAEQLDEELAVPVVPMRSDEFRCTSCFLVRHRSQLAGSGADVCQDCA